jgi:hypothetical protein
VTPIDAGADNGRLQRQAVGVFTSSGASYVQSKSLPEEAHYMRRNHQSTISTVKRIAARLAAMVTAISTITAVTAGSSFARTFPATALATSSAGYGYFNGDVQILAIHDSHSDGYGVAIIYYRYDLSHTGPYYAWNREGSGTTTYLYLNMPPGTEFRLYSCPEQGGIVLGYECGARATATVPPIEA